MSNRYKGGVISATPPTTTGGESGTASGAWTLEQQMQLQAAGLWPIQPPPPYIEDVFSTYLYTGNGTTNTIVNGLNLAGKGGLVWIKGRNTAYTNLLFTSGLTSNSYYMQSNGTNGESNGSPDFAGFNSNGFTLGAPFGLSGTALNGSGNSFVSWSLRKQPKFFDVVTWAGNSTAGRQIPHNLGSVPGCIMVKTTNSSGENWNVYHRSLGNNALMYLNTTDAKFQPNTNWNNTDPTSTVFTVSGAGGVNYSGYTYVAYLFAHDAGGFGLTETDNVISCGSYTGNGSTSGPTVTLGYEPQWLLIKNASSALSWYIVDNMRGFPNGASLFPNENTAESDALSASIQINATGFTLTQNYAAINASGSTYIYIAIRRGPMKVPTSGTSVYQAVTRTGNSPTVNSITSVGFPPDSIWQKRVSGSTASSNVFDRLRGRYLLAPSYTDGEVAANTSSTRDLISFNMTGFSVGEQFSSELNANTRPEVYWNFGRAPNFFDEVCYTGTGSATTVTHNLTVVPQMMIVKRKSGGGEWAVYHFAMGNTKRIFFDTAAEATGTMWNNTTPTSSVFSVGTDYQVNLSASTYIAYLFATCAGVSKVGSYTGTGALLTVDCGFTSSARFILIKRTDSTGGWFVYDSARGISSSNDPYLLLNSTAVEVTGTNYVDTDTTGFKVTAAAPAELNASGGSYIFLAIA